MNITLNSLLSSGLENIHKEISFSLGGNSISEENGVTENTEKTISDEQKAKIDQIRNDVTMNVEEVKNFLFMLIGADIKVDASEAKTGNNFNTYV